MSRAKFPATRLRRNRRTPWLRDLVRENTLQASDFIWPLFIIDGTKKRQAVEPLPSHGMTAYSHAGGSPTVSSPRRRLP